MASIHSYSDTSIIEAVGAFKQQFISKLAQSYQVEQQLQENISFYQNQNQIQQEIIQQLTSSQHTNQQFSTPPITLLQDTFLSHSSNKNHQSSTLLNLSQQLNAFLQLVANLIENYHHTKSKIDHLVTIFNCLVHHLQPDIFLSHDVKHPASSHLLSIIQSLSKKLQSFSSPQFNSFPLPQAFIRSSHNTLPTTGRHNPHLPVSRPSSPNTKRPRPTLSLDLPNPFEPLQLPLETAEHVDLIHQLDPHLCSNKQRFINHLSNIPPIVINRFDHSPTIPTHSNIQLSNPIAAFNLKSNELCTTSTFLPLLTFIDSHSNSTNIDLTNYNNVINSVHPSPTQLHNSDQYNYGIKCITSIKTIVQTILSHFLLTKHQHLSSLTNQLSSDSKFTLPHTNLVHLLMSCSMTFNHELIQFHRHFDLINSTLSTFLSKISQISPHITCIIYSTFLSLINNKITSTQQPIRTCVTNLPATATIETDHNPVDSNSFSHDMSLLHPPSSNNPIQNDPNYTNKFLKLPQTLNSSHSSSFTPHPSPVDTQPIRNINSPILSSHSQPSNVQNLNSFEPHPRQNELNQPRSDQIFPTASSLNWFFFSFETVMRHLLNQLSNTQRLHHLLSIPLLSAQFHVTSRSANSSHHQQYYSSLHYDQTNHSFESKSSWYLPSTISNIFSSNTFVGIQNADFFNSNNTHHLESINNTPQLIESLSLSPFSIRNDYHINNIFTQSLFTLDNLIAYYQFNTHPFVINNFITNHQPPSFIFDQNNILNDNFAVLQMIEKISTINQSISSIQTNSTILPQFCFDLTASGSPKIQHVFRRFGQDSKLITSFQHFNAKL